MKKIFAFLLFILISTSVATADDFMSVNNIKYVSSTKAEEMWGVDI